MFKRVIKEDYKVPADINYLGEMRDFITRVGRKYGVSERIINAFKLAIDEAGTNIIRHAYRDWEGFITIQLIVREKNVTVSMIDQGHTFDPNNVRDPDLQRYVEIGKKGGLGIFIIRRVIDEIEYRKTVNGNELRLTKKRDVSPRRRFEIPEIPMTMKTRFSLVASGILTSFVLMWFVWSYIQQDRKILKDNLAVGGAIARSMVHQCLGPLAGEGMLIEDMRDKEPNTQELVRIATEVQREYNPLVAEAIVVDSTGRIQGVKRTEDFLLKAFIVPSDVVQRGDGVKLYAMPGVGPVYEICEPVIPEASEIPEAIGTIHLLLDKATIDAEIASARIRTLWISGILLLVGYLGVFVLVYMTMSPFKKLSRWVGDLGRGEAHDDIEFDASDEVGEIAQAFSEITEKFRKSQQNLAEQERLQKEMQVAQEIQHTLLPSEFPEIEGYEIASYYEAAKEVGGDYFDFVEVDKDTLGIVVADVSGKGVPGSLVMTMIRTALRTEARGNKNAADVLARVNDFVINDMKRGMFVTIFYVILDSKNRTINYASAGHNPMILYRGKTKKSYYFNPRGFPIGINLPDNTLFRKSIQSDTLRLLAEDVLLVYTDGITEAMNSQRDRFGDERFLSVIRNYSDLKVDPLVDKIRDEINMFTKGHAQSDDITLVAIKEKLKAEDVLYNLRTRLMRMVNEKEKSVKEACQIVGVSTSTYYKYKKRFEKMGADGLKEKFVRSEIEEKHISIEDMAKIYDIIREHPEFGPKRIHEELNSEKYGFAEIDERNIYAELVRSRLNTKALRSTFIEKGGRGKRMKPPGTPLLTLDGQVIVETKIRKTPMTEEALSAPEEEQEEKAVFEMHVSQRPKEEIYSEVDEDKSSVLDEFLGLAETHEEEIEEEFELNDDETAEDSIQDLPIELKELESQEEELLGGIVEEEGGVEQVSEDLEIDEIFNELVVDIVDINEEEPEYDSESAGHTNLDQILEMDAGEFSEIGEGDQIEDRISSSIAGELFGEDMGMSVDLEVQEGEAGPSQEEGFLEMMEGVEFDRMAVLSDEGDRKEETISTVPEDMGQKILLESGLEFYREGLYSKAIEEFQKAVEKYPNFVEACQCLGDTFFRMGRLDKAKEAYERVRQLDPDNVNVLENLGVIFANRGDYKKAVWQWGEVLKRTPERRDIISRIKKMQRVIRQRYL